jgi:hypothetical protein
MEVVLIDFCVFSDKRTQLTVSLFLSGWSALESPNLGSFGISQVFIDFLFCWGDIHFVCSQNDAGLISGSSIAAAALGSIQHLL